MPEEKIIVIKEIGEILFKKSKRFKRLSVRIAPNKGVWVNVPFTISYKEAIHFSLQNKEWIKKNQIRAKAKESNQSIFSPEIEFKTRFHKLQLCPADVNNYSAKLSDGNLQVTYPLGCTIENKELQSFIQNSIIETLRREANYYLPKRIKQLAETCGFNYQSLTIKNTKSRWGSCSHDNKINLNLHLMRLPHELCDMVILHELCHTIVKNHSKDFYHLLEQHCSELKRKRKAIKNYSTTIY
ncbi:M48 family metallopeptidase [Labilibaculum sp.]|uniref:M48 family metallopeptidase n=1 Tax=Labilibaculum sp. TaxID=2060723 RepID=UPI003562E5B3